MTYRLIKVVSNMLADRCLLRHLAEQQHRTTLAVSWSCVSLCFFYQNWVVIHMKILHYECPLSHIVCSHLKNIDQYGFKSHELKVYGVRRTLSIIKQLFKSKSIFHIVENNLTTSTATTGIIRLCSWYLRSEWMSVSDTAAETPQTTRDFIMKQYWLTSWAISSIF